MRHSFHTSDALRVESNCKKEIEPFEKVGDATQVPLRKNTIEETLN